MMGSALPQAAVFLAASAIAAPLGRWLKAGSVIGYLAAGVLIGPYGLGFVYEVYQVDAIFHIAELGVALLLVLIGPELRPARLWSMRRAILCAGGVQLAGTAAVLAAIALVRGQGIVAAVVLGWALAMSSTALALQALEEREELNHRHGRLAFSTFLFQDFGALPLIAIVPLLCGAVAASAAEGGKWLAVAKAIGIIAGVVIAGRWLLGHVYALVARSGVREAMTASALLTVVAIALAMQSAGLSPALVSLEEDLAAMAVPGLVVVGDEDTGAVESGLFLKKASPAIRLAVAPATGHLVNLEEQDLLRRLIEDFYAAVEPVT